MARRLAAILAADVVGYSRLMAADEAGTHARLKALRKEVIEPKIAAHHGRIAKLMGDGALVEFASVVDAVECAAAIQAGVVERQADLPGDRRIALRIGINIGDVIIEGDDIYGDGVQRSPDIRRTLSADPSLRRAPEEDAAGDLIEGRSTSEGSGTNEHARSDVLRGDPVRAAAAKIGFKNPKLTPAAASDWTPLYHPVRRRFGAGT
jgi:hypothetical protein